VLGASDDVSGIEVVAIGTGSKCIGPEKMDKNGNVCVFLIMRVNQQMWLWFFSKL